MRTLEQKISDGGPFNQRIDPHVLTSARNELIDGGSIVRVIHANVPWFHLEAANPAFVASRLAAQLPTYQRLVHHNFTIRLGQTLEIATYRAFALIEGAEYYGMFSDLNDHDDSALYTKVEPPSQIGSRVIPGGKRLDFIFRHPDVGPMGIECKNVREWIYPDREEIIDLLHKCLCLDCVPVFVARRIPFVTFKVFSPCGVIFHQNYNQLFPAVDHELATLARTKDNLGYHDVRLGNAPDARLQKFVTQNLPSIAADARQRFEEYKDLLHRFVYTGMSYAEFAARTRRRSQGLNEDHDWGEETPDWYEGQT